jgi:methylase of polypeptide subunit release factors
MDVAALLKDLARPSDLGRLIRALGHELLWQDLPPDDLPMRPRSAALVGRSGSFEWIAVEGDSPEVLAARLSAALTLRGRLVGALALDTTGRKLAVAVTVERTAVACFPLDNPRPPHLDRLSRLLSLPPATGLAFALRALEVLEGEDLGRRFFQAFGAALDRMAAGLPGPVPDADRRALALIQLTRVLFLYFVQAKGWLDNRPDFLRRALDDALALRRRVHRDLFRPLFFGTLNREPAGRGRARLFGRIPFLNGGLFEPHPLERAWRGDIPNGCWREAFDRVFERFHFTVHEQEDPARIAPEMLGRVFEGLMAPEHRRTSGAYYTPAPLVERMVDAALAALLRERLGVPLDQARDRLARPDDAVRTLLCEVTILDPAVGSGAFLLGALERLAALRAGEASPAVLRRRILERNLFGVDLNPMAVRLAELRLWLAVIAVEEVLEPERVTPLPNLDGLIRQGDSLLDPAASLASLRVRPVRSAAQLRHVRRSFVGASGPEKRDLLRRLRRAEMRALEECLEQAQIRLEQEVAECLEAARSPTLFGERRGLDARLRRRLRVLRLRMAETRRLARRLHRQGEVPWFSYETQFGDVLARGGFDLVLGNPPWVRAEQIPPGMRAQLTRRFRWWHGTGRGFVHQPDLALAFVERAGELVAQGGVMALLVPAKVTTAGYGRPMRGALAERSTLYTLANLTEDPGAAFDATTYPAAIVAARSTPREDHDVRLTLEPEAGVSIPQRRLAGGGPWVLAPPAQLEALSLAQGSHPRLGERFTPRLGVKTGANVVFLDPPPSIESTLVRQALRGRDIRPFKVRGRVRLLFPHSEDGAVFNRLPEHAARHVRTHEALLRARVDYQGGPPWTLFRVAGAVAPHRVVWPDLARRLTALALSGPAATGVVPLNSCYLVRMPDRNSALALAAWLNCTWLRALARASADVAAGGFARFNGRVVAALPLPRAVLTDHRLITLAERGGDGAEIQEELDAVCAEHLALPETARELLARAAGSGSAHCGRGARRNRRPA